MNTLKCSLCNGLMIERVTTENPPYQYAISGLADIVLIGITVRKCSHCGAESPIIPRIPELHNLITEDLLSKPDRLSGNELRFLRKHVEFSAKHFAALLKVDPSYLSRVEKGHRKSFGDQTDKLARALIMALSSKQDSSRRILELLAEQTLQAFKKKKKHRASPAFRLVKSGWKAA